jgi:hypothetical protein
VSKRLSHGVRQGVDVQKGNGTLSDLVRRGAGTVHSPHLGLFDRPAEEKTIYALLEPPVIPGLTESLRRNRPGGDSYVVIRLTPAPMSRDTAAKQGVNSGPAHSE